MDVLRLTGAVTPWSDVGDPVTVRGRRYLWGSSVITTDIVLPGAVILHLANDRAGEPVTVGTRSAAGADTALGVLLPGECLSVSVSGICGVYAECATESVVHRVIRQ